MARRLVGNLVDPGAKLIKKYFKNLHFHFHRMEKMNDTDELFKYELKNVEKIDATTFKVNCESDLFVDLDNEWHVS
jgi:hypothetical protein